VAVHVSIHDVSPAWRAEVEDAIELCAAAGARPALLVVPDFHRRAPMLADGGFCNRLRELQARGHEMYLHGLFHRSGERYERRIASSQIRWWFAQRVVSGGEAEMSDVSPEEGHFRLDEGERILHAAGLQIDGYVAPAWSMPPWLRPALARRGYRFTEDHLRIYDPAGKRSRPSVVLNWASRSPARIVSTIAWCRVAKHARALFPARIAIHPGDMNVLLLRREIVRLLAWAEGDFVARGRDLFGSLQ